MTVVVSERVTVDPFGLVVVVVVPLLSVVTIGVAVVVVRLVGAGAEYDVVFVVAVVPVVISPVAPLGRARGPLFVEAHPPATISAPAANTVRTARLISICLSSPCCARRRACTALRGVQKSYLFLL